MKKTLCIFIAIFLICSMAACGSNTVSIDPVLAQRRDEAESYMRSMLTVLWSPQEDILYTLDNKASPQESSPTTQMLLRADRLYRGMPYSYAGSTLAAFLEYAGEPDSQNIYTISDLPWIALSRNSELARVGLDGSSSLMVAWARVARSFTFANSSEMTPENGYLHVGDYEAPSDNSKGSDQICQKNGPDVMYAAYAQLLKADGLFTSASSGAHTMMVVETHVVKDKAGVIDPEQSYVITLEQSKYPFQNEEYTYDEHLGCDVYTISSIDKQHTFKDLFNGGYLPITCKELIDPTPLPEADVSDTNPATKYEVFYNGYVQSNYHIDTITTTITDRNGNVIQEAALRATRYDKHVVAVNRYEKDPAGRIRGELDFSALDDDCFHCTTVCRLINGQEFIVRDFDFEKG